MQGYILTYAISLYFESWLVYDALMGVRSKRAVLFLGAENLTHVQYQVSVHGW